MTGHMTFALPETFDELGALLRDLVQWVVQYSWIALVVGVIAIGLFIAVVGPHGARRAAWVLFGIIFVAAAAKLAYSLWTMFGGGQLPF